MKNPLVTIVVPSYQQAPYLRYTLQSLVNQQNLQPGELEIIVMDGGSTDGSVEIIQSFEKHLEYWESERDRGQTHALRKGFARARGEILGWLCSDDLLEPTAIRTVINLFRSHSELQFLYGDTYWIDTTGAIVKWRKEIAFNWFIWKYDHNYIPQPSAFWKRELYEQSGGLDESFDLAMDADLWARFATVAPPRHFRIALSRMRMYPQQKTQRLYGRLRTELRQISSRYGAKFDSEVRAKAAYLMAKSWRIGWKLATGCYWQARRGAHTAGARP